MHGYYTLLCARAAIKIICNYFFDFGKIMIILVFGRENKWRMLRLMLWQSYYVFILFRAISIWKITWCFKYSDFIVDYDYFVIHIILIRIVCKTIFLHGSIITSHIQKTLFLSRLLMSSNLISGDSPQWQQSFSWYRVYTFIGNSRSAKEKYIPFQISCKRYIIKRKIRVWEKKNMVRFFLWDQAHVGIFRINFELITWIWLMNSSTLLYTIYNSMVF